MIIFHQPSHYPENIRGPISLTITTHLGGNRRNHSTTKYFRSQFMVSTTAVISQGSGDFPRFRRRDFHGKFDHSLPFVIPLRPFFFFVLSFELVRCGKMMIGFQNKPKSLISHQQKLGEGCLLPWNYHLYEILRFKIWSPETDQNHHPTLFLDRCTWKTWCTYFVEHPWGLKP